MASIGDVVTIAEGSTGVVGESFPSQPPAFRVFFGEENKLVTDADITATLSAPAFTVNDTVTVWPFSGDITAIDGDEFTVSIERQKLLDIGPFTWVADHKVPRWQIIRDNDPRIARII